MSDPTPLLKRLQNHVASMQSHQRERYGGKLLVEATAHIRELEKQILEMKQFLSSLVSKEDHDTNSEST